MRPILDGLPVSQLRVNLRGCSFVSTFRHGKYLLLRLSHGPWMTLHFVMTGGLLYFNEVEKEPRHTRILVRFSNGYHLAYGASESLAGWA